MQEETQLSKPEFIASGSDENIFAKQLEKDIFERPKAYRSALILGNLAVLDAEGSETPVDGDIIKRLDDLFAHRLDMDISFDDDTEDALSTNAEHRGLITALRSAKQDGEVRETLRNNVRYSRLAFFVDRVVDWKEQQEPISQKGLRRTG